MLPSKRDFTSSLPWNAPAFPAGWWGWSDLDGGGVTPWGLQSPWDGLGLGLAWREVHRSARAGAALPSTPLPLHASSPSRVTLAERKEWMMKTMVLGQE